MRIISTGSKALDWAMDGGLKSQVISILFGIPNLGKTWLCYQLACMCTRPEKVGGLGKKALYYDTEGFFFTEDTIQRFAKYFKARWPDCDPTKIEIVQIESIFTLGQEFGMQIDIKQEQSRTSVITKFPTARQEKIATKKGKSGVDTTTNKDKDWLDQTPIFDKLKERDYGLLIIDSLTIPIKSEIASTTQNFPARTSLVSAILGACYPLARRMDIPILITDHITANPMSPGYAYGTGDPWGGRNILYYVKHIFGLYRPLKDLVQKYAPDGLRVRRFQRYRYPGLDPVLVAVKLEKDKGYMDLPDSNVSHSATPEE